MDHLYVDSISFPVKTARFSVGGKDKGWSIEIYCDANEDLESEEDEKNETAFLIGTEPYFYAQMLPIPTEDPAATIGKAYTFPQRPDDDPAPWDRGIGWLFFCLYLWEHELVYPAKVTFLKNRGKKYRVKIEATYPRGKMNHRLAVETWLTWDQRS